MRKPFLLLCFLSALSAGVFAQTGCPGCSTNLPANLPADTIYLPQIPDGTAGQAYSKDISFRMPKTTTPVHAVDSTTPPGLTLSTMEILSIDGLPPGLTWEASQTVFQTATETDGCIRICGTPLVSDSFKLTVKIRATVLFIKQEDTFPMSLYIAPKSSTTDGFAMDNVSGCGTATVGFTNNIPSGDVPGFFYTWDFGDGDFSNEEDPGTHVYEQPGTYIVNYQAIVDSAGFVLESARVLGVTCVDQLGLGAPDLYVLIKDPNGTLVYNSSPAVDNTPLPRSFVSNLKLGPGNYTIEVWDEDGGLKGGDDPCGTISFNALSNDTLVSGGFRVVMNIIHVVDTIRSTDTVRVYPVPALPLLTANDLTTFCAGDSVQLKASYNSGNQWLLDGVWITDAVDSVLTVKASGAYQVLHTTADGCSAISAPQQVTVHPLPTTPVYINVNNSLRLYDTTNLANYALQWYNGPNPIPGATEFRYCATASSEYGLEVVDLTTGCRNYYSLFITLNPLYDCTIGTSEAGVLPLNIQPNPAQTQATLQWPQALSEDAQLLLRDLSGRLLEQRRVAQGAQQINIPLDEYANGIYLLDLQLANGQRFSGKLVVLR